MHKLQGEQDNLSNVARLTMLMAMFIEIVGKNTEESLQNDLALFNALQEGRQAEMEKKSAEFQEETRKAEETNRIMGCIGKVLGALLTIVSVVAAVFTGGASLALSAWWRSLWWSQLSGKARRRNWVTR